MKSFAFSRVFVGLLAAAVLVLPALAEPRAKHVVIVSYDGGKPAVIQQSPVPVLSRVVQEGAHSWEAQTIFPSITLVSHTSMLTGVSPEKHQVNWNGWVPEKGRIATPTAMQFAHKAGLRTALFAGKDKFLHLDQPESLDDFAIPSNKAKEIAEAAGKYIEEKKPNLLFVHFPDSDSAGHRYGWGSPEQIQAFADQDVALNTLLEALKTAGIEKDTVLIVSADHGGHDKTHGSRDPQDMTIPWIVWGKGVKPGYTITAPVTTYDTAATALWLLGLDVPADWDGKPVTSAFTETPPAVSASAK